MYSFNPSLKNTLGLYIFKSLRQETKIKFKNLNLTLIISLGPYLQCSHKRQYMINLAMLSKLCLVFSSNKQKLNLVVKNLRMCVQALKNTLERTFSDLWSLSLVFVCLKITCVFYFFKIFKENQTFKKVPCFTLNWWVWLMLDLP